MSKKMKFEDAHFTKVYFSCICKSVFFNKEVERERDDELRSLDYNPINDIMRKRL
jgi:hypothetical protein